MMPTIMSTKLGIDRSENPYYPSGLVLTTRMHDDFECPSPRDYVDIKVLASL
jgi:hypothetical protein